MTTYESIFAVKVLTPDRGAIIQPGNTPQYHIHRQQFEADNDSDAKDEHRRTRASLEDCFTQAKTLLLTKGTGASVPKYEHW